jgi:TRAP-type C4-dicarboxylate transport system substrate-binding protein
MNKKLLATLATAVAMAALSPAMAQDKITLRVADHYAPTALTPKYSIRYYMDYITKKSGGRIQFQYFPAEQLGKAKDMLALVQQGVLEIGFVAPAYVSDKLPLSAAAELPGTYSTSCEGVKAYWKLAKEGILAQKEFAPNKIRPVFAFMLPPYQLLTREPITSLGNLVGKKMRSGGSGQDITIKAVGAVPVRMGGVEVYEALSRGTLDGAVFPLQSAIDFRLPEILKASTKGANFGGFATTYAMSQASWQKLPDDIKALFDEAGEATVAHACASLDADDSGPAIERLTSAGVAVSELPPDVAAEVKTKLADVNAQWAKTLDGRGLPGSEVLNAFLEELAKNRK